MAYSTPTGIALRQGDLLAGVRSFSMSEVVSENQAAGILNEHIYSVVVTQDCDLEQDYRARFPAEGGSVSEDKLLFGVLVCGVFEADQLKAGTHRSKAKQFGKNEWKPVTLNQDPRYQFLGHVPQVGAKLVADFKDFFMVPCDFLYRELQSSRVRRQAEMASPWKEHLLQRFAWYLMRVGLPSDFCDLPEPKDEGPAS